MAKDRRTKSANRLALRRAAERQEYSIDAYRAENRNPAGAFVFRGDEGDAAGSAELDGTVVSPVKPR